MKYAVEVLQEGMFFFYVIDVLVAVTEVYYMLVNRNFNVYD